ncbi:LysR family transcriptional regulator protein [Rhizobium etli bv. mimosae str. IE4771]|uniref:HTH-type transcriptional regulator TtuA n=1 Tax=Rhizobium etli bv. mimosae str. IE4771 TaxID=1432050 RepID=A0A060I3E1_RHIET|nr:LysR family transcriptional regulator protein [Rhizobium sp. IE4771]
MTNLGDLEIFAKVVSTGSMSLAGRMLGFSPAVVSKRIKRLEDRLGTRLLQRTTRQISLTEAGQGFYDRVLGILAGLEEAEFYISGRAAQMHGTLKISAPTSFGRMHIAPHLKAFMQAHPELAINLVLTDEFSDIVGGGFDLAIRIAELTDSSLVARRLAPVRRLLCASPDYLSAHGEPRDIDDLKTPSLPAGTQWRQLAAERAEWGAQPAAGRHAGHQLQRSDPRGCHIWTRHRAALYLGYRRRAQGRPSGAGAAGL